MKTYIWGLDLSMSRTGIAIFNLDGSIEKICSVATNTKDSHGNRLKTIYDYILSLKTRYPAEKVIIERGFFLHNNSTEVIFRVHGIINLIFCEIEQIYYPPTTIKATIVGGKATKKELQESIIRHYSLVKFDNEDESDAFAIGITYLIKTGIVSWDKEV